MHTILVGINQSNHSSSGLPDSRANLKVKNLMNKARNVVKNDLCIHIGIARGLAGGHDQP